MTDNLKKAREARTAARDDEIWAAVERVRSRERCHCNLRRGMSRDDLPGGSGCQTDYICSALDTYRRMLPPAELPEEERALQAGEV